MGLGFPILLSQSGTDATADRAAAGAPAAAAAGGAAGAAVVTLPERTLETLTLARVLVFLILTQNLRNFQLK